MVFNLELGKHSATGKNRQQNEDNVGYYFPQQAEVLLLRGQMFMITDGNGEEGLGVFASKIAVQTVIQEYFEEPWVGTVKEMLSKALARANQVIYEANIENNSATPFSASLTCAVVHQENLYIAHIGNCRAYLFSDSNVEILTQSHSFDVNKNNREIDIQGEENGKVLVRCLGVEKEVKIDVIQRKLQINDMILLCSDGVYLVVPEEDIHKIVASSSTQQACDSMVNFALDSQTQDDATSLMVKVKSIKRIQADEIPATGVAAASQDEEHQIVIKGVRYRSSWKGDTLPPAEDDSVAEFTQDRDVRRPIVKRTSATNWNQHLSLRKILNIFTLVVLVAIIILLIVRYGPKYWRSGTGSSEHEVTTDTLNQVSKSEIEQDQIKQEIEPAQVVSPSDDQLETSNQKSIGQEPAITASVPLNIVIIDGSFKRNLSWEDFMDDMKAFSDVDRIVKVSSSYRLKKSKILWRRRSDYSIENIINERLDQYQRLFSQYFKIKAEVSPLDLTLVIGADFNLPRPKIGNQEGNKNNVDYYLEILNGFTVTGLARRMSEQLYHQQMNQGRLIVVDYRNADKRNYRVSFIKCDSSRNELAEELKSDLGQSLSIVNSRLFDIKLIIGTDIVF